MRSERPSISSNEASKLILVIIIAIIILVVIIIVIVVVVLERIWRPHLSEASAVGDDF